MAGGGNLEQDYKILLSFLEKNFEVKSAWRKDKGLLIKEAGNEDDWVNIKITTNKLNIKKAEMD